MKASQVPKRLRPLTLCVAVVLTAIAVAVSTTLIVVSLRPPCSQSSGSSVKLSSSSLESFCPKNCQVLPGFKHEERNSTYRVSGDTLDKYLHNPGSLPWSPKAHPGRHTMPGVTAAIMTSIQRSLNVHGAVGEIGVHHGAYFLSLALTAHQDEQLWALDIFEQQGKNVDQSGQGDYEIFAANCRAIGIQPQDMLVTKMASTEYTISQFCEQVPQQFRFLSIDGGHTREIVYSDIKFAECHLAEGGIVSLDDYTHPYWVGVHEGVVQYFTAHSETSRLAPFFLGANKLYLTTKTHHAVMLKKIVEEPLWRKACTSQPFCIEAPGVNGGTLAKFNLAGWGLAVTEHRAFDEGKVLQRWKQLLTPAPAESLWHQWFGGKRSSL